MKCIALSVFCFLIGTVFGFVGHVSTKPVGTVISVFDVLPIIVIFIICFGCGYFFGED
jgi:amino acid transporter